MGGHHLPNWLEAYQCSLEAKTIINTQHPHSFFTPKSMSTTTSIFSQPFKIQRLSPKEMENCQRKGIYYNFDQKYVMGHSCCEHKIFHMDVNALVTVDEVSPEESSEEEEI